MNFAEYMSLFSNEIIIILFNRKRESKRQTLTNFMKFDTFDVRIFLQSA